MNNNISVIGLGKLGSCMAAVYADKGHRVIGVDINPEFVAQINAGQAPVSENNLADYISRNQARLSATTDFISAINNSAITFIIVPTPTDASGGFSVDYVLSAAAGIGAGLKQKSGYHLVVLTSTVLPKDCELKIIPELERHSGKKCGLDFGFCYSPEFIAIGSVVKDLLAPDFFLIGEYDKHSGDILTDFYATINNSSPVARMSIPSAELAKISLNSFLTMKITFGNMLAEVAENISGVHVDDVARALGNDSRIGHKYLRGGLGYGGPCFPRDNRAFATMAARFGVKVPYALATDNYNQTIPDRAVALIKKYAAPGASVAILGLSYKPGTAFSEESQALQIARQLTAAGYKVRAYNPAGNEHARTIAGAELLFCDSVSDCALGADVLFLSNPDPVFQELLKMPLRLGQIIIDPWRQLQSSALPAGVKYFTFGVGI